MTYIRITLSLPWFIVAVVALVLIIAAAFLAGMWVVMRLHVRRESAEVEYHRKRAESRERYARELSDKLIKALNDNADLKERGEIN